MRLVRTPEELKKREEHYAQGSMVGKTKFLFASFLTDPQVVKRLLPPPLEPAAYLPYFWNKQDWEL